MWHRYQSVSVMGMSCSSYPSCLCREYAINLEEGSQHLIRYRTVAPLVASGAVQLI